MVYTGVHKVNRDKVLGQAIRINTKLSLKVSEGQFAGIYPSRVEDIGPTTMVISGPTYKGVLVPVAKGSEITINSVAENGVYEFKAITQEVRREPIYQLDLDVPADEPIHHLQRRQFMRLNLHLRVTYQILSNNQNVPDESSKKMEAMSKDISGNGICLIMDERLPKGTRLDMFVPLLPDRPPIYVVGEIVRADDPHGETHRKNYDVGIRFVEIRLTDQDRIVKYVFEQERKRAQKLGR